MYLSSRMRFEVVPTSTPTVSPNPDLVRILRCPSGTPVSGHPCHPEFPFKNNTDSNGDSGRGFRTVH